MSGFEIAGIVLGALPIVIEVVRTARGVLGRDSQKAVSKLALRIEATKIFYVKRFEDLLPLACSNFTDLQRTHIKKLSKDRADIIQADKENVDIDTSDEQLASCAVNDEGMNALISLLDEATVRIQIKQYLGDEVYNLLEKHIDEFSEQLSNVCTAFKKLLPKDVTSVSQTEHFAKLKALLKSRFKPSTSKSVNLFVKPVSVLTNRKIQKLEKMVDKLEKLEECVNRLLKISPCVNTVTTLATETLLQGFELVRTSALSLYSEIERLFKGSCHTHHTSHLYLEDRHKSSDLENPCFRISLLYPDRSGRHNILHNGTVRTKLQRLGPVRVLFHDDASCQEHVQNLCSDIQKGTQTGESVQLSLSNKGRLLYGSTLDTDANSLPTAIEDIDLATILGRWKQKVPQKREIPHLIDRIHIALSVASSFLQLNRTGWGNTALQTRGIRLEAQLHTVDNTELYILPEIRKPFVRFIPGHENDQINGEGSLPLALTSLAIVLLEVYLVSPFSDWKEQRSKEQVIEAKSQLDLVRDWAEDKQYEVHSQYHDAISFCLAEASLPYRKWSDTSILRGFVSRVIQPLRELCKSSTEW